MKSPRFIVLAIVVLVALAGLAGLVLYQTSGNKTGLVRTTGKALVGGPFTLTDHTGKTVTDKSFVGKYMLIYFGYTYCPDVCPTELQVMTAALDTLGEDADKITPVFVSIDPERDTVEVMKDYVANFHPRMVGLTGTKEQVAKAAKAYRVYYSKAVDKDAKDKTDYAMDHSSIVYLMGPDGNFLKHFSYGTDAKKMAAGIKAALRQ